jgi:hypothetical protein
MTAPQRQDIVGQAGDIVLTVASHYTAMKIAHLHITNLYAQQRICFVPCIIESTGA